MVEVREDGAYANLVWPAILEHRGISQRDAAFATELGYGTLRWLGRHDTVLAACVDRDLATLDPSLLDALRLGVHQLHNMRVPAHAAVSETVTLVAAVVNPGAARMANAVLRRVAAGGDAAAWLDLLADQGRIPTDRSSVGYLAVAWSHPSWIVAELADALAACAPGSTVGAGTHAGVAVPPPSDLAGLLAADNTAGPTTLVARTIPREQLITELHDQVVAAVPGTLSRLAVRVTGANPAQIPQVARGVAGVQDEGSQLVALSLADAPLTGRDRYWLDLCAGPGGKAAILAGAVAARGGWLTALELHEHRAELVRRSLRPIPGRHRVLCCEALSVQLEPVTDVAEEPAGFDRVLVDAPCTGLGALRRRPESRWRRTPQDVEQLVELQGRLLDRALELVRPGGLVMYVTCSPVLAETSGVVDAAVQRHGDAIELVPVAGPSGTADGPYLRTWPHRHDTDGMFAALLRRRA